MLRPLSATMAALALLACSDTTAPEAPSEPLLKAQVSHERVVTDLTGLQTPNDCTGELITADGWLATTIHQMTTPSGQTKLSIHQQAMARGVSDAGVQYNLILVTSAQEIDHANGSSVLTAPFTLKLVGQGPGNNSFMKSIVHITTGADGEITSHVDRTEFGCR